jgi:hypothetical protein
VPFHELTIQVFTIFRPHEWSLSEDVLDLCSYFAEFDVFNQWDNSCVFTYQVLKEISKL